jgi:hypothetical protein
LRSYHVHEVGAVGQPVEGGGSEQRFTEQLRPLRPISVARQNNRRLLIPLVDDVVEILRPGRAQRLEAEVIELCGAPHNSIYGEPPVMWSAAAPPQEFRAFSHA